MSTLTLGRVSVGSDPLMRESPLPDVAGLAGFFDVAGRVVVAIAKGMAPRGLRPEGAPEIKISLVGPNSVLRAN